MSKNYSGKKRLIQSVTGKSRGNIKDRLYFKFKELQTQKDLRIVSGCMRELFPQSPPR